MSKNSLIPSSHDFSFGLCLDLLLEKDSSSLFNSSFCSLVKLTGVSIFTLQYKSPLYDDLTDLTPLFFILNARPLCVPAGTVNSTLPSSVGRTILSPSVADVKLIGTSHNISSPSLWKNLCGLTLTDTNRSPETPLFGPPSPSPDSLIWSPLSTPAGILTANFLVSCIKPDPLQSGQFSSIICPLPLHTGHVY